VAARAARDRGGCRDLEIDPRRLSGATVDALAAIRVNRASLGVQDVNPEVQRAINRRQPFALVNVRWTG
jgi:oxygen-independent coproporphyrinogen III oxidase